jgi:hypothetical protein
MTLFAHVIDGVVTEVEEFEIAPDATWIETDYGIRNRLAYPGFVYDAKLDMFFMPAMEEPQV